MSGKVFPFNSLSCTQTPFQFPKLLKVDDIPEYKISEIRIVGTTPGPGRVLERAARDGQLIEENPQISLIFLECTGNQALRLCQSVKSMSIFGIPNPLNVSSRFAMTSA
jgi:hypothetical protein